LGRYFVFRLRGKGQKTKKLHKALTYIASEIARKVKKKMVSENEQPDVYRFLFDLVSLPDYSEKYSISFQKCREWKCIEKPNVQKIFPYMNNLQRLYTCQNYLSMDLTDEIGFEWKKWEEKESNFLTDMGLLMGWANEGLLHLLYNHQNDYSWFNLL